MIEKLVATIARDAIDGTEAWKTVAFMLLDLLMYLCQTEKQSSILTALTHHGILSNFVHGLKESDVRLQGVLKPYPGKPFFISEFIQTHLFDHILIDTDFTNSSRGRKAP